MGCLLWIIQGVAKLILRLVGLALILAQIGGASFGLWKLVLFLGLSIIPWGIIFAMVQRRMVTYLYIWTEYLSDRTSTWDRVFNPDKNYYPRKELRNRLSMLIVKLLPDMRDWTTYADFESFPYGLYDVSKARFYWRRTSLWTLIVIGISVACILGYIDGMTLVIGWAVASITISTASYLSRWIGWLRRLLVKRYNYLFINLIEINQQFTFGIAKRRKFVSIQRLGWIYLMCAVLTLAYWYLDSKKGVITWL